MQVEDSNKGGSSPSEAPLADGGAAGPHGQRRARWVLVLLALALVAYPAARWMGATSGSSRTAADGRSAIQASVEHYTAGRYQDAVDAAKAAIGADPNSAEAYNNLAVSYLGLRQYDEGIAAAQHALQIQPNNQLAKNNLAWIEREKEKASRPPVAPERAGQATTLLNESVQHAQAQRYRECIDTAGRAAKLNPNLAPAFSNLGFCSSKLQRWDDAVRYAEEAVRLDPSLPIAQNNLNAIRQERAKANQAAVPPAQVTQAAALLSQSLTQAQAQRYRECLDTAGQAAKLNPNLAPAFNNLGFCASKLQRWDDAIRSTEEAIRLDPTLQIAKNNLLAMRQEKAKADASVRR